MASVIASRHRCLEFFSPLFAFTRTFLLSTLFVIPRQSREPIIYLAGRVNRFTHTKVSSRSSRSHRPTHSLSHTYSFQIGRSVSPHSLTRSASVSSELFSLFLRRRFLGDLIDNRTFAFRKRLSTENRSFWEIEKKNNLL